MGDAQYVDGVDGSGHVAARGLRQDGWTPLNSAASNGHEGVVRLLVEAKAAVDTANNVSGAG